MGVDNLLAGLETVLQEDLELAKTIDYYNGLSNFLASLEVAPAIEQYCESFYQFQILLDRNLLRKFAATNAAQLILILKNTADIQS